MHRSMMASGFDIEAIVANDELEEKLKEHLFKLSSGNYTDIRVIPGDVALKYEFREDCDFERPAHIIYAKIGAILPRSSIAGHYIKPRLKVLGKITGRIYDFRY